MAGVGEVLASVVLREVARRLGSAMGDQITTQWNFTKDLDGMRMTLESVNALLRDAERRSAREEPVRLWLKRLKNAAYDISEMLDEFQTAATDAGKKTGVFHSLATAPSRFPMVSKMKRMRKKLAKITEEHKNFSFMPNTASVDRQPIDPRPQLSEFTDETAIVGRSEDKQNIIVALLTRGSEDGTIILPIYGIGGVGKTTLAHMVFDDKYSTRYNCLVWVHVSQDFDLNKIGNTIISHVAYPEKESFILDHELMRKRLGNLLEGRKILIILDDIWESNQFNLDTLKCMLNVGKKNSELDVIVTTRMEQTARKVCTVEPYKLETLNHDICWDIVKRYSAFEDRGDKQQLEVIGQEIATKCGGVPLAARALGYALHSKTVDRWLALKNSEIWDECSSEETSLVLPSLKLSFYNMPSCLRMCLAYCAIYAKGCNIEKDDLIHQWITLGFIEPHKVFSATQIAEDYVKHLLGISFLQHSRTYSTSQKDDRAVTLTMHDLVHDISRSVIDDELFFLDGTKENKCGQNTYRYVLLTDYDKPLKELSMILHGRIRALHLVDYRKTELNDEAFSSAKRLIVLDLSHCSIQKLPDSIYQLKQLQYLRSPRVQDGMISESISKLSKLNYLNLRGSSEMSKLPESFGKLEALMCLNLSGCSQLVELPESFGELRNLKNFDISVCSQLVELPESFGVLRNLKNLDLSGCSQLVELPESIGKLEALTCLNLSGSRVVELPESFCELENLEHLDLSNCTYVKDVSEHSGSLNRVNRTRSYRSNSRWLPEVLGSLTKLQYLNLSSEFSIVQQAKGVSHIHMKYVIGAKSRLVNSDSDYAAYGNNRILSKALGSLTKLKYLNLSGCRHMISLPKSFRNLENLVHLDLSGCFCFEWEAENLVGLTKLQYLNLSHYCIMDHGRPYHLYELPDILISLTELRYLSLAQCLTPVCGGHRYIECICTLSNLEHLDLSGNLYLSHLPESVGKLKKLHTLDLSNCCHLKSLPESLGEISCLKFLNVTGCRELELVMSRSQLHQNSVLLPNFVVHAGDRELGSNIFLLQNVNPVELQISCLENVQSAGEVKRIKLLHKTRISKLTLEWTRHAKRFANDMNVLGELVPQGNLRHFELRGYSNVCLPSWLVCISSYLPYLVQIVMDDITSCSSLPPLGQLQNLQELTLRRMPRIRKIDRDLCGGSRAFIQLQKLTLDSMENLEEWNTAYNDCGAKEFMFPSLEQVAMLDCPKLRLNLCVPRAFQWKISKSDNVVTSCGDGQYTGPSSSSASTTLDVQYCKVPLDQWTLLCHLPALYELRIYECNDLTCNSPEIIRSLSSLKLMKVECQGMAKLPAVLCELKSLPKLILWKCLKLMSLPESIKHLTSLESLWLSGCASMTSLPEGLGDLSSLRELNIIDCPHLKSLPESIQLLPMLEDVKVSYCPELNRWYKIEENKMKLAHIRKKYIL